jgi:hypothetical protein
MELEAGSVKLVVVLALLVAIGVQAVRLVEASMV